MLHPKRKNEAQREAPPLTPRSQRLETLQKQRIYSAQRSTAPYTARSAPQRPALRCAERSIVQPPHPCAAQRAALHSAQHYTAPSTASQDKADRSKRTKHIQVVEYFSQRSTAAALKRYASV